MHFGREVEGVVCVSVITGTEAGVAEVEGCGIDGCQCRVVGINDNTLEGVAGPRLSKITSQDSIKCPDGQSTRR